MIKPHSVPEINTQALTILNAVMTGEKSCRKAAKEIDRIYADDLDALTAERDQLLLRVARLEDALSMIRYFPVHSEPMGVILEIQEIARAAVIHPERKEPK